MPLTLREVLSLEVVRRGAPKVVAAADRLDVSVRWVHVAELSDVGRLLRGGELVLSTGIALPSSAALLADYVAGLAGAGVAGLAVELGQRYVSSLPSGLVAAAEARGMPLIAFEREVPFVEITEAVHAQIIDGQHAELVSAQQVHSVFTSLSVEGAPAGEIVAAAARLAGRPVILADLAYRVLASSDGMSPDGFSIHGFSLDRFSLDGFADRARAACEGRPRTFFAPDPGWLVTTVGARGEDWGRLFLVCGQAPASGADSGAAGPVPASSASSVSASSASSASSGPATADSSTSDLVLLERAATTLALGRLLTRQAESVERQAHRTLISAIMSDPDLASAAARARAMGVPVAGRQLVALVARIRDPGTGTGTGTGTGAGAGAGAGLSAHAAVDALAGAVADACRDIRVPALVGSLDDLRAGALLSLPPHTDADTTLRQLTARLSPAGPADGVGGSGGMGVSGGVGVSGSAAPGAGGPTGWPAAGPVAGPEGPVIGVGSPAADLAEARRSFLDAREVADAAIRSPDGRRFYRLPDLRLRGLLHLLRDDARLVSFAERELGALRAYDEAHGTSLLADLAVYLECGGNKAAAAARAHLARPTFYQRLRLIERILGVSLDSAESRTSLQVALLTLKPDA
ncbi:MAG TPA: PucR family transcriptional regulator [Trebonia sp.]